VLLVGASVFTWLFHTPGSPFRPEQTLVQLDEDPAEVGKSYPVTLGLVGDVRAGLAALREALDARLDAPARAAAAERAAALGRARQEHGRRLAAEAEAAGDRTPISAAFAMHTLGGLLDADAVVVDESASSLPHVLRHLPFGPRADFFGSKTGTLGWALGAAVGVQLAWPRRQVVATVGDGAVMYAPQALWTAARLRLPITYVVLNNASYAILKSGMVTLGLPSAKRGIYPGMDLVDPEIDHVALARALGVMAVRVDTPASLRDALAAALAHRAPALVDVPIDRAFERML
jgi:benzoylformate decarboxylase